jgi:hypothetical protein
VGLTKALESGFSIASLPCPPLGYTGPSDINGYPVCQEYVPDTTIMADGSPGGSYTSSVIFDTGTAYFIFNVPTGSSFPSSIAAGTAFQVATPSGFVYSAPVGTDLFAVNIGQGNATTAGSVVGLGYFKTNSLIIDFANELQGWK